MKQEQASLTDAIDTSAQGPLRCFRIRIGNAAHLLLPNTLVAEVVEQRPYESIPSMPSWVLGKLAWRGREVPLIDLESMLGQEPAQVMTGRRYLVLNTLNGNPRLPFIAMAMDGLPHTMLLSEADLRYDETADSEQSLLLTRLIHDEDVLWVPDLDEIERRVEAAGLQVI